jgi:AcrR family transcriptional regulator
MTGETEPTDADAGDAGTLKGKARVGAERRAAIVDAAIEIFAVRGFRGGVLAEVAERVGLTPPGILYHFGSKEALLVEVLAERDRRQSTVLGDIWEGALPAPILETLRASVRFAEISEHEPGLTALHSVLQAESLEPDHPAHDYFQRRSRVLREATELALRVGQEAGEVRGDVDCAAKAREWVAFLEGAAMLWLVDRSVSLVELYRNFAESFTASISARPPNDGAVHQP